MRRFFTLLVLTMGLATVQAQVTFYQDTLLTDTGAVVRIPVRVRGFEQIVTFQFSMRWDSAALELQDIGPFHLRDLTAGSFARIDPGTLALVWFDNSVSGLDHPADSAIFFLTFRVLAPHGSTTQVAFSDNPTEKLTARIEGVAVEEAPSAYEPGIVVVVNPDIRQTADITPPSCFGGADGRIRITVQNGVPPYRFRWTGPDGFERTTADLDSLRAGAYQLTIRDSLGNEHTREWVVGEPPPLTLTELTIQDAACGQSNGAVSIGVSGGTPPYRYDTGGGFQESPPGSGLPPGDYPLRIEDANACRLDSSFSIAAQSTQPIGLGPDLILCFGDTAILSAGAAGSFRWSRNGTPIAGANAPTLVVAESGNYSLEVTDGNNCRSADTIVVDVQPPFLFSLGADTTFCSGTAFSLEAPVSGTYRWSTGATGSRIEVSRAGTYGLTVTNNAGSTASDSRTVAEVPDLQATLTAGDPLVCTGRSTVLTVQGADQVEWLDTSGTLRPRGSGQAEVSPRGYTTYGAVAGGACGTDTLYIEVDVIEPMGTADPDTTVLAGSRITLGAGGGIAYLWTGASQLDCSIYQNPTTTVEQTGDYLVRITDRNGCIKLDTQRVTVFDNDLRAINVLTPNGDGRNDELVFPGLEQYPQNTLRIFNRWGRLVYEKRNYQQDEARWRGEWNGRPLPAGVYYYILDIESEGLVIRRDLTLLRAKND